MVWLPRECPGLRKSWCLAASRESPKWTLYGCGSLQDTNQPPVRTLDTSILRIFEKIWRSLRVKTGENLHPLPLWVWGWVCSKWILNTAPPTLLLSLVQAGGGNRGHSVSQRDIQLLVMITNSFKRETIYSQLYCEKNFRHGGSNLIKMVFKNKLKNKLFFLVTISSIFYPVIYQTLWKLKLFNFIKWFNNFYKVFSTKYWKMSFFSFIVFLFIKILITKLLEMQNTIKRKIKISYNSTRLSNIYESCIIFLNDVWWFF